MDPNTHGQPLGMASNKMSLITIFGRKPIKQKFHYYSNTQKFILFHVYSSYANGMGFNDHFTNDSSNPWKDIRNMDYKENKYRAPALTPTADGYETHAGEDVPILANGPWAHLFTGQWFLIYFTKLPFFINSFDIKITRFD